ncbi:MAG: sigma-70 family RNA polymerase sigma factor [Gemmatimonadota bacterium]|nr:sigma-70 family RNA polymerase sigma factor [Gemmatimonadota bacterium]
MKRANLRPGRGDVTDLVESARRNDAGAFDRLYRDHADRVYALCLRMTADPDAAETLTQDVFVRAWRRLDSFRGDSRFSTWLHRLTVNLVLDRRRSAARRRAREENADRADYLGAVRRAAPGTRMDLERAIAKLPEGARTMLVLYDVEGYAYEEIAEMTDVALGTVKSQLHRARKLMREELA